MDWFNEKGDNTGENVLYWKWWVVPLGRSLGNSYLCYETFGTFRHIWMCYEEFIWYLGFSFNLNASKFLNVQLVLYPMLKKNGNGNRYKLIFNPVRAIKMQHEIGFTCIMLNDKVTNKRVKKGCYENPMDGFNHCINILIKMLSLYGTHNG